MRFRIVYNAWWIRKNLATVVWPWIWCNFPKEKFTDRHYRHELQHCYQVKRMGRFKFYITYLYKLAKYGYEKHPYEEEARERADTPLSPLEKKWKELGVISLDH